MNDRHWFDPFEPCFASQRYARYQWFREHAPIARGRSPSPGLPEAVYLFSHETVRMCLTHRALLQAPDTEMYRITRRSLMSDPVFGLLSKAVLFTDPPVHGTLRRPMTRAMTATAAAQREASLRTRAEALVQAFEDRGHFDLVTDFATPYIVGAIGELLGLTLTDIPALKRQTTEMARALDLRTCEARPARNVSSAPELAQWVECALDTTLVSDEGLCATFLEHCDSGQWTRSDVITNMVFLLFAGQETAVDALGNATLAIARHPGCWDAVTSGAVASLDAVDELLRYDPSLQFSSARVSAEPVELTGTVIPAGIPVIAVLASANRDPEVFDEPDNLRLDRRPGPGMTFGHGIHRCAGAHVARVEIAIALETLMRRLPAWRIDEGAVVERDSITFRGHTSIPVTLHTAGAKGLPVSR